MSWLPRSHCPLGMKSSHGPTYLSQQREPTRAHARLSIRNGALSIPNATALTTCIFPKLESQCVSARSSVTACRLAPLTCVLSFTTEPSTREHHLRHGAEMQANASVAYTLWGFPYFFELPLPTETQPLGGGRGSLSEWGHWAFWNCSPPVTMESRTSLCRDKWTCCKREPASKPTVEGVSNLGS